MGIVKVVKGNLLAAFKNTDIELIAHGCNCRNLMGAGIAQKIAKIFPKAEEADRKFHKKFGYSAHDIGYQMVGEVSHARTEYGYIFNLYTQLDVGKCASYRYLVESLEKLRKFCWLHNIRKIGLPMIGAGIGGLDAQAVKSLINSVMYNVDVYLYVYDEAMASVVTPKYATSAPQFYDGVVLSDGKTNQVTLYQLVDGKVEVSYPLVSEMGMCNSEMFPVDPFGRYEGVFFDNYPAAYIYTTNQDEVHYLLYSKKFKFIR